MRAGYTPGPGLLVGSDDRWLLASLPPHRDHADRLWQVLVDAVRPDLGAVADLADSLAAGPVDLVLVDLRTGRSLMRGGGGLAERSGDVVLTLSPHDPAAELPLESGAVAAASVRLVGARLAAPVGAPAAGAVTGLIDGIPRAIREQRAPEPPARLAGHGSDSGPMPTTPPAAGTSGAGGAWPALTGPGHTGPGHAGSGHTGPTGPTPITTEPEEHTRVRIAGRARISEPDHDGHTVTRADDLEPLRQYTGESVHASRCPAGHLTPPHSPTCRICGVAVPAQTPIRVPRPPLGVLRLPDGQALLLDRGAVLGRQPQALPGETWPHLVQLPEGATHLSRMHVHVELDGWNVLARDLGSRAGTVLVMPGRPPERLRAHEPHLLEDGAVLHLAEEYAVRYATSLDLHPEGAR